MPKKRKRTSATLPVNLLTEAMHLTNANQTNTIILGLENLVHSFKRESILKLKGKLKNNFDIDKERQRARF